MSVARWSWSRHPVTSSWGLFWVYCCSRWKCYSLLSFTTDLRHRRFWVTLCYCHSCVLWFGEEHFAGHHMPVAGHGWTRAWQYGCSHACWCRSSVLYFREEHFVGYHMWLWLSHVITDEMFLSETEDWGATSTFWLKVELSSNETTRTHLLLGLLNPLIRRGTFRWLVHVSRKVVGLTSDTEWLLLLLEILCPLLYRLYGDEWLQWTGVLPLSWSDGGLCTSSWLWDTSFTCPRIWVLGVSCWEYGRCSLWKWEQNMFWMFK